MRKDLIDTFGLHLASFSLSLHPHPPHLSSAMPFERYLRQCQEPTLSSSFSAPINDDYAYVQSNYPSSSGSALDPFAAPPALQFQMPQFMLDGPPTLAQGGGAEVLPAGFVSSKSLASAWIANTGFVPNNSEDVYVRLQYKFFSFSTSLALTFRTQNTFITLNLLRAIISQQTPLYSPVPPPSLVLFSHIRLMPLHPPNIMFSQQPRKISLSLLLSGHPPFPPHPPLVCLCIHHRASTSYQS